MHSRAALLLLTRTVNVFPTKSILADKLLKTLTRLQGDNNPMQHTKAMAQSYSSQIIKARNDGFWREEIKAASEARNKKMKEREE
mmetsp:Transcript_20175/g.28381  ORF Transcript_20175/g.28381 Transcript_20175/m.28381 type:complete len:85 (+) Transcript_20175:1697-1951(+)